jgi:hypothetical protein
LDLQYLVFWLKTNDKLLGKISFKSTFVPMYFICSIGLAYSLYRMYSITKGEDWLTGGRKELYWKNVFGHYLLNFLFWTVLFVDFWMFGDFLDENFGKRKTICLILTIVLGVFGLIYSFYALLKHRVMRKM